MVLTNNTSATGRWPQKAENAPYWQRGSQEEEKPKNGKCSLDFRISSFIQPYLLGERYSNYQQKENISLGAKKKKGFHQNKGSEQS